MARPLFELVDDDAGCVLEIAETNAALRQSSLADDDAHPVAGHLIAHHEQVVATPVFDVIKVIDLEKHAGSVAKHARVAGRDALDPDRPLIIVGARVLWPGPADIVEQDPPTMPTLVKIHPRAADRAGRVRIKVTVLRPAFTGD